MDLMLILVIPQNSSSLTNVIENLTKFLSRVSDEVKVDFYIIPSNDGNAKLYLNDIVIPINGDAESIIDTIIDELSTYLGRELVKNLEKQAAGVVINAQGNT